MSLVLSRERRSARLSASADPSRASVGTPQSSAVAVLRAPGVVLALGGTLLGRLPSAMAPVALLCSVTAEGGGYAKAGTFAAVQGIAAAIGQPVWGRQADRRGHRQILAVSTALTTAAFLLLAAVGTRELLLGLTLTILTGLCAAPLQASLRTRWALLVRLPRDLPAALALDSASAELLYVGGPLLSAWSSRTLSPSAPFYLAAVLGVVGTAAVAGRPGRMPAPSRAAARHWLGPLRSPGIRGLAVILTATGVVIGSVPVAGLVLAQHAHSTALNGGLPAAFAVGALLGGVTFAARRWPGSSTQQLGVALSAFLAGCALLPTAPGPWACLAVVAPGLLLTPVLTTAIVHVDSLVPAELRTEAHALLIGLIGVGEALGAVAAGVVAPTWWPAAGAAGAVALFALTRRHLVSRISPAATGPGAALAAAATPPIGL